MDYMDPDVPKKADEHSLSLYISLSHSLSLSIYIYPISLSLSLSLSINEGHNQCLVKIESVLILLFENNIIFLTIND